MIFNNKIIIYLFFIIYFWDEENLNKTMFCAINTLDYSEDENKEAYLVWE